MSRSARDMGWSPYGRDAQRLGAKPDQPGDARSAAIALTTPLSIPPQTEKSE